MLVDLRAFDAELTGKEAEAVLDQAGITLNKNTIPDDPRSPFVTSGVRIGTPAVTTQGMKRPEMAMIAISGCFIPCVVAGVPMRTPLVTKGKQRLLSVMPAWVENGLRLLTGELVEGRRSTRRAVGATETSRNP